MNCYLDTSALIKLYHQEDGSDKLTAFLKQYAGNLTISVSDISPIEFHSAFLRRVRMNEISLQDVQPIFEALRIDLINYNIAEVDSSVKQIALELLDRCAAQQSLRTLDALQLAAAILSHRFLPIDFFIAADSKLLNVAQSYFPVFNPQD